MHRSAALTIRPVLGSGLERARAARPERERRRRRQRVVARGHLHRHAEHDLRRVHSRAVVELALRVPELLGIAPLQEPRRRRPVARPLERRRADRVQQRALVLALRLF